VASMIAGEGGEKLGGGGEGVCIEGSLPPPPSAQAMFHAFCGGRRKRVGSSSSPPIGERDELGNTSSQSPLPPVRHIGATTPPPMEALDSSVAASSPSTPSQAGELFDVIILQKFAARVRFLRSLNLLRSQRHELGEVAFPRLARALWWLLDASLAQMDVQCARMAMIMGETFYFSPPSPSGNAEKQERLYLQRVLRTHPLWRVDGFWEEQFYAGVYEAVVGMSRPYREGGMAVGGTPASPASVDCLPHPDNGTRTPGPTSEGRPPPSSPNPGAPSTPTLTVSSPPPQAPAYRPGSNDWVYAYEQTIFSQLLAIAHNMSTFGAWRVCVCVCVCVQSTMSPPPAFSSLTLTLLLFQASPLTEP